MTPIASALRALATLVAATVLLLVVIVPTAAQEGEPPAEVVAVEQDALDTDGDGLPDDQEHELGTDPLSMDSDFDGMQDGGELNIGTDPLKADTDGDGFSDLEEYDVQSDPLDPNSVPVVDVPLNSISVTLYTCEAGLDGKILPDACITPAAGVDVTVYIPGSEFGVTHTTDANGTVTFTELGTGRYVLRQDFADLPYEIDRYTAFFFGQPWVDGAPEPRQVLYQDLGGGEYAFDLTEGEDIFGSWYNVPEAEEAPVKTPVPTPKPAGGKVTALPSTGTGAASGSGPSGALLVGLIGVAGMALAGATRLAARRA